MHEIVSRARTLRMAPEIRYSTINCIRLCHICHTDVTEHRVDVFVLDAAQGADGWVFFPAHRPKGERGMPKYEAHITCERRDALRLQEIAAINPGAESQWTFSQIDGDPLMGKTPYAYLTAYDSDALRLKTRMNLIAVRLRTVDVPVLRCKIEQILYDTKTGVDDLPS